jgi:glycosyltransferase involved in cell wall biosynthesis
MAHTMSDVDVSVVMGVYNGIATLEETLRGVLGQQDAPRMEFIVVDDGSSDGSGELLDTWAKRDARLRVIHQANTGLTRALIRGCGEARGEFIARQDCGDMSLPHRIGAQWRLLRAHPEVVLTACAVQFVGPGGERLYVSTRPGQVLHDGLGELDADRLKGPPHHGATMFRRSAYERAGGYRAYFAVAQDIDLWLRLRELGLCIGDAQVGYVARVEAGGISTRRRDDQLRMTRVAVDCARTRAAGRDDMPLLQQRPPAPVKPLHRDPRAEQARFLYFVGSCLRHTDPAAARRYFWQSFLARPLMLKSLVRAALGR